jgi:transposase-like protein
MAAMARHGTHGIALNRRVAQAFLAGETLHRLAKRHDPSRNLTRVRVETYEVGAFDDEMQTADLIQAQEARIAGTVACPPARAGIDQAVGRATTTAQGPPPSGP